MKPVAETIRSIREMLREADVLGDDRYQDAKESELENCINRAFSRLLVFLEANGLMRTYEEVRILQVGAPGHYTDTEMFEGHPDLVLTNQIWTYTEAVEATFGVEEPPLLVPPKDLIDILRQTQYAITDKTCYATPPRKEDEVQARVECVLKCIFPELIHNPPIPKPIKNFAADTGLPGIRTLIEYKFVENDQQVKRVVDEILADTRAYTSKEWGRVIYVIYETHRVKSEAEWNALLKSVQVDVSTKLVVISGS
jgi:REase_DpnII-MboI